MDINLERKYYEVKNYIDTVDFSRLWKNFKPFKFALYTDKFNIKSSNWYFNIKSISNQTSKDKHR